MHISIFPSYTSISLADFETQIFLCIYKPFKKGLWKIEAPGLIFGIVRYTIYDLTGINSVFSWQNDPLAWVT